jgi:hypothetical protein
VTICFQLLRNYRLGAPAPAPAPAPSAVAHDSALFDGDDSPSIMQAKQNIHAGRVRTLQAASPWLFPHFIIQMIIRQASGAGSQCCYFALLGALQHSGRALGLNQQTLKQQLLNYMYQHRRTGNHFVHAAFRELETLDGDLRAERMIGRKLDGSYTEEFSTMERWHEVVALHWRCRCAFYLLIFLRVAGHVAGGSDGHGH